MEQNSLLLWAFCLCMCDLYCYIHVCAYVISTVPYHFTCACIYAEPVRLQWPILFLVVLT